MSPTGGGDTPPLIPPAFVAEIGGTAGPDGLAWIDRLPQLVAEACDRWSLTVDGPSMHGVAGLVVPVRGPGPANSAVGSRSDPQRSVPAAVVPIPGTDPSAFVLKVTWPHAEAVHEADALRCWAGAGAVRLLAEHAPTWSLLLERLDGSRSLESLPAAEFAETIAADLLPRLHVAPPPGIPTVRALADRWAEELPVEWEATGRPIDRRLVDAALSTGRDLAAEGPAVLLHGDFHYANVLAGEREPWLAIDPKPLAGPPEFDVAPLLRNRWSDLVATGDVPAALRRRFDHVLEVSGLDPGRARAWAVTRAVDNVLWATDKHQSDLAFAERTIAETLT